MIGVSLSMPYLFSVNIPAVSGMIDRPVYEPGFLRDIRGLFAFLGDFRGRRLFDIDRRAQAERTGYSLRFLPVFLDC